MNKLEICKRTRKIAADSLYKVLKKLLASDKPISEVMIRDAWLKEMQKNKSIFPEGWYQPPPYGMIVLFADENNVQRFNYISARPKETWPRKDIFLNKKKGILFCYASPVDKKTGIIGDFGLTLYFGDNQDIKNLLKTCLTLDREIFDFAKVGMKISDITQYAKKQMEKYGMTNQAISITDKTDDVTIDIGHGIPESYIQWVDDEKKEFKKGFSNWQITKDIISKKRFFVTNKESLVIKPPIAFTIEPRPKIVTKPQLPSSMNYHTVAFFKEDGTKELLTGFDELFTLAGMEYMMQ